MEADGGFLTSIQDILMSVVEIAPQMVGLAAHSLFAIAVTFAVISLLWRVVEGGGRFGDLLPLVNLVVLVGVVAFLLRSASSLLDGMLDWALITGGSLAGLVLDRELWREPSTLLSMWTVATEPLMVRMEEMNGLSAWLNSNWWWFYAIAYYLVFAAFFVYALLITFAVPIYYVTGSVAFVMLALAPWGKTSFAAERALAYFFTATLLMVGAAIGLSMTYSALAGAVLPGDPTFAEATAGAAGVLALPILAWLFYSHIGAIGAGAAHAFSVASSYRNSSAAGRAATAANQNTARAVEGAGSAVKAIPSAARAGIGRASAAGRATAAGGQRVVSAIRRIRA